MSRTSFENYGRLARNEEDSTVISGRYAIQRDSERLIVSDIVKKLRIGPDDRLLEIGCGAGNLLIPLSFMVKTALGMDHPDVCEYLRSRFNGPQIELMGLNFLDFEPEQLHSFDKILIYSVLNTLSDEKEAMEFVDKAVALLAPHGRLLLGDIANSDCKQRFLATQAGRSFDKEWKARLPAEDRLALEQAFADDEMVFRPSDEFVLSLLHRYRKKGYGTYLLPQPDSLPFGHTREDLLVIAPENLEPNATATD